MKKITIGICLVLILSGECWASDPPEVMVQTVAMESAGEPLEGQAMVARVILNRAKASVRSVEAVCKAPRQFSCWNDPKWASAWLRANYTPIVRLRALNAINKAYTMPASDVRHYHTKSIKPYWAKGKRPTLVIGRHCFYGGIK